MPQSVMTNFCQRGLIKDDLTDTGQITAAGHALVQTDGTLINHSHMQAGALTVRGQSIENSTDSRVSGDVVTVQASDRLTNRGLIDGYAVRVEAGTLDNLGTGRLYGDDLMVQAGTVDNRQERTDAGLSAGCYRRTCAFSDGRQHAAQQ